jgi:short-subunit dehydrogenase
VTDVNLAGAQAVADEIRRAGSEAEAHALDVTDFGAVKELAEALDGRGGIKVLHNNAGIAVGGPIEDMLVEDWRRVIEVNLMGVVHGIHAFLPGMLERGRPAHIVNTASAAGLIPSAQLSVYSATKYAVVGLSEVIAAELRDRQIYVSAICPGIIDTAIVGAATMRGSAAEHHEKAVGFYDRFGSSPDVVARAVLDAIAKRKVIRTTPRWHVVPGWIAHRLSTRLGQGMAKGSERFLLKRD